MGTFDQGVFSSTNIVTCFQCSEAQLNNLSLEQNYPNPFNPSTTIKFSLPRNGNVKLEVFNSLGQKVATVLNKQISAGTHSVNFNADGLSSGVYLYKMTSPNFTDSKKCY